MKYVATETDLADAARRLESLFTSRRPTRMAYARTLRHLRTLGLMGLARVADAQYCALADALPEDGEAGWEPIERLGLPSAPLVEDLNLPPYAELTDDARALREWAGRLAR